MDIRSVKFRVRHEWRVGGLYTPSGAGTGAAVLMLHGFPGVQQNEDIAAELCRRGMTVFMPHFCGCWGSSGQFSIHGLLEDAEAALRLLSRYHHVDSARVGLLGFSLGGWIALKLASQTHVAAVAVLAPAMPRENEAGDAGYLRRNARVVNIPHLDEVWTEYMAAAHEDHPDVYLQRIAPTPVLFVQGLHDRLVPPGASAKLWSLTSWPKNLLELPNEDHEFQNDRPAVIAAVCGWLEAQESREQESPARELVAASTGGGRHG